MSIIEKLSSLGAKASTYPHEQNKQVLNTLELRAAPLPAEYKEALLFFGGDVEFDVPVLFSPVVRNPWSNKDGKNRLGYLYGLQSQYESSSLIDKREMYDGRITPDLLVIGDAPGGNQICLGVSGSAYDKVYFWDHEGELDSRGTNGSSTNLYLISNTFRDFVESLEEDSSGDNDIEGVIVDLKF